MADTAPPPGGDAPVPTKPSSPSVGATASPALVVGVPRSGPVRAVVPLVPPANAVAPAAAVSSTAASATPGAQPLSPPSSTPSQSAAASAAPAPAPAAVSLAPPGSAAAAGSRGPTPAFPIDAMGPDVPVGRSPKAPVGRLLRMASVERALPGEVSPRAAEALLLRSASATRKSPFLASRSLSSRSMGAVAATGAHTPMSPSPLVPRRQLDHSVTPVHSPTNRSPIAAGRTPKLHLPAAPLLQAPTGSSPAGAAAAAAAAAGTAAGAGATAALGGKAASAAGAAKGGKLDAQPKRPTGGPGKNRRVGSVFKSLRGLEGPGPARQPAPKRPAAAFVAATLSAADPAPNRPQPGGAVPPAQGSNATTGGTGGGSPVTNATAAPTAPPAATTAGGAATTPTPDASSPAFDQVAAAERRREVTASIIRRQSRLQPMGAPDVRSAVSSFSRGATPLSPLLVAKHPLARVRDEAVGPVPPRTEPIPSRRVQRAARTPSPLARRRKLEEANDDLTPFELPAGTGGSAKAANTTAPAAGAANGSRPEAEQATTTGGAAAPTPTGPSEAMPAGEAAAEAVGSRPPPVSVSAASAGAPADAASWGRAASVDTPSSVVSVSAVDACGEVPVPGGGSPGSGVLAPAPVAAPQAAVSNRAPAALAPAGGGAGGGAAGTGGPPTPPAGAAVGGDDDDDDAAGDTPRLTGKRRNSFRRLADALEYGDMLSTSPVPPPQP